LTDTTSSSLSKPLPDTRRSLGVTLDEAKSLRNVQLRDVPFSAAEARALQSGAARMSALLQRHHDEMTGVLTRALYDARAVEAFSAAAAATQPLALLHVDVDLLHVTNERHGYAVGDEVLRLVARALVSTAPVGALVARVAGDRFAVLSPTSSADAAVAFAGRVRRDHHRHAQLAVVE